MHHRLEPREHKFTYSLFMFYLDLDEIDHLQKKLSLFSLNRFNWFSFYDRSHMILSGKNKSDATKVKLLEYLNSEGIREVPDKVMLLTNASVLGYGFNPISVYLCFDKNKEPQCAVAEVCNTHGEMKLYLLDRSSFSGDLFDLTVPKLFYVSPFVNLDASFRFIFTIPNGALHFRVDDYQQKKRFLLTSLQGKKKALTDLRLLQYAFQFPLITLRIVAGIHWQALILWLKRIPFKQKNADQHLQQNMVPYK